MSRTHTTKAFRRLAGFIPAGVATALILLSGEVPAAVTPAYPELFGTSEKRSVNLKPFPKWTGVLERYFKDLGFVEGNCDEVVVGNCHLPYWDEFVGDLIDAPPIEQLDSINRYMNDGRYTTDLRNYNVTDYWATPKQFFILDGDCEDYAIAKFTSLRALGWDNAHMRIVVVQDLNLKVAHAILAAYVDGSIWILDNQIKQLVTAAGIRHYRPLFSLNEEAWWIHRN